jgi:hypothetical protein
MEYPQITQITQISDKRLNTTVCQEQHMIFHSKAAKATKRRLCLGSLRPLRPCCEIQSSPLSPRMRFRVGCGYAALCSLRILSSDFVISA